MEKKTINIKTPQEVEAMSLENTAIDPALRERWIALKAMIASCEAETKKIQAIVLDKYGHKPVKTGEIFKAIVFDTMTIDESKLVELYGEEALALTKIKPKHTEYIKV